MKQKRGKTKQIKSTKGHRRAADSINKNHSSRNRKFFETHSENKEKNKKDKPEFKLPEELIKERNEFPESVLKETAHIKTTLSDTVIEKELSRGRRDLREMTIVTIDSEDTKDVDDGVSIEALENGTYILGVHIADVAHYVKEGTALDKEAYERGTSVYLPGKVLPMLPTKLSNGICSLNVGEDRLALSVIMEINSHGEVKDYDIFESIICVKYKITYKQIDALLNGDNKFYNRRDLQEKFSPYVKDIENMRKLALKRRNMRRERGAIDFCFPETYVTTDEDGKPTEVGERYNSFANNIIEEFMLAANETVAEQFEFLKVPFMYRVHGTPEREKMENLSKSVRSMGYTLKGDAADPSYAIQSLLEKVKGKPVEQIINMLALRSMPKAEYSPTNDGHFGLAADFYTHFTSPIRRYPDLFIHRVIKAVINDEMTDCYFSYIQSIAGEAAKQCSLREREAENAERIRTDMLVAEYMNQFTGDVFDGTICNITSFGIFVKLKNTAEGLVFYNSMPDYMIFDEKKMMAVGETNHVKYAIGDKVRVKIINCNIKMGQIEFHFCK